MVSVRFPQQTIEQLDSLAVERGTSRTRVVRQLVTAGLSGQPAPSSETPTEAELVALLSERARAGNVAAIRSLLVRTEQRDDVDELLEAIFSDAERP